MWIKFIVIFIEKVMIDDFVAANLKSCCWSQQSLACLCPRSTTRLSPIAAIAIENIGFVAVMIRRDLWQVRWIWNRKNRHAVQVCSRVGWSAWLGIDLSWVAVGQALCWSVLGWGLFAQVDWEFRWMSPAVRGNRRQKLPWRWHFPSCTDQCIKHLQPVLPASILMPFSIDLIQ